MRKALFSFVITIIAVSGVLLFGPQAHVAAQATTPLYGWAWSDTIGWISFNCNDLDTCATSNYGVVENSDGSLTGYAWSTNIGWIEFGNLSSFPTGAGTQSVNASVDSSGVLHGWIRACAGTAAGDCSSMTSRTDGWDGWISLGGTGYSIVSVQSGTVSSLQGFAWGSTNVGWVLFNPQSTVETNPDNTVHNPCTECGVVIGTPPAQDLLSAGIYVNGVDAPAANPVVVTKQTQPDGSPASYVVSWNVSYNGAYSLLTCKDPGGSSGSFSKLLSANGYSSVPQTGSISVPVTNSVPLGESTYNINCFETATTTTSSSDSASVSIVPPPVISGGACTITASSTVFTSGTVPVAVGQNITWGIRSFSGGTSPYSYAWTFTGNPASISGGSTASPTVKYSTTGTKSASVTVSDSVGNSTAFPCAPVAQVQVNPTFIEK
jgi:hypothetical protein